MDRESQVWVKNGLSLLKKCLDTPLILIHVTFYVIYQKKCTVLVLSVTCWHVENDRSVTSIAAQWTVTASQSMIIQLIEQSGSPRDDRLL